MSNLPSWKPLRQLVQQERRTNFTRWLVFVILIAIASKVIFQQLGEVYVLDLIHEKRVSLFCQSRICSSPLKTTQVQLVHFQDSLSDDFLFTTAFPDSLDFQLDSTESAYTFQGHLKSLAFLERQFDSTQVIWNIKPNDSSQLDSLKERIILRPEMISTQMQTFYKGLNSQGRLKTSNILHATKYFDNQFDSIPTINPQLQIAKSSGFTPEYLKELNDQVISLESADKSSQDFYLIFQIKSREVFGLTLR